VQTSERVAPAQYDRPASGAEIRTGDLTKVYHGDILAVARLTLDIRKGEFFGLLGPIGAGEATTIGMLTTSVRQTHGDGWVLIQTAVWL
jgi:ABC-type multidrug transport system ATPase subunit